MLLSLLGLFILLSILINVTFVQNFLVKQITEQLSDDLKTTVSIKHVDFQLFDKFRLDSVFVADRKKDTLLFAGKVRVNITNFFFLKNKAVLKYVSLQDAVINLKRPKGDSVWNYQFIIDAFASPKKSTSSNAPPAIDLKKIDLRNIRINQVDAWRGEDMHLMAERIYVDIKNLNLIRHQSEVNAIELNQPVFAITDYAASRSSSADSLRNRQPSPKIKTPAAGNNSLRWNTDNWQVQVNKLTIQNGAFGLANLEHPVVEKNFDPAHIGFYDINAGFDHIRLVKDSIISDIRLSTKERSGFEVRSLRSRFKFSPEEMEFADLDLITNNSELKDYFAMRFGSFGDMSDFIRKISMQANFKEAKISSDDIAYFAPALADWKMQIKADGNFYGTVDNLSGNNMDIETGSNTRLKGNIKLRGLPDINETFIDFKAEQLHTGISDLQRFVPSLKTISAVQLHKLSSLSFNGNFTGFIHDFVAYGNFNTSLGNIHSDLNMKLGRHHKAPVYSGKLSVNDFDIGSLLGDSILGRTTLTATIDGQGLNFNTLKASVKANIDKLSLNGYTYQHIKTNGDFNKKLFNGSLLVEDSSLSMNFAGTINFNDSIPLYNFKSEVFKSDLRALHLTDDSITFKGILDLNFAASNIDNFTGEANLHDISLFKSNTRVEFDSLDISAHRNGNNKLVSLRGNEIEGSLSGAFDFSELPGSFLLFLYRYYPSLIKKPASLPPDENFSFQFSFGNVEKIIHAFTPRFSGLNGAVIKGSVNDSTHLLFLDAAIPSFSFDKYRFTDIAMKTVGDMNKLTLNMNVGGIFAQDSLLFPQTKLTATAHADTTYIGLKTSATNTLNNADISGRVITIKNGYRINILNSELVINDKAWKTSPDNEILLAKDQVKVYNFKIGHNEQLISLMSDPADTSRPSFLIKLQNINISDFSQFSATNMRLEGLLDGMVKVSNPVGNMYASGSFTAHDFRMNNDSIGLVNATATFDKVKGLVTYSAGTTNPMNGFSMNGSAGITKENTQLAGEYIFQHTDISTVGSFITNYVNNLSGYATGTLKLSGTRDKPSLTGNLRMDSMGVKINYLGTYYTFSNATIQFTDNMINLGSIKLYDPFKNTATLTGRIRHDHFNKLYFDNIVIKASKFQFLNTTYLDNQLYFGDAFVNGTVNLSGPLNDMQMNISVTPVKGTHLFLPISDSKDIGKHDFIIFKQYGTALKAGRSNSDVNLTVKLNASMNDNARIDVILDAATGDKITATGNGPLQMNISLNGDFSMYGNYVINNGSYTFTLQQVLGINRDFKINQGSTITWNGDPKNAIIHATAIYHVPGGASLYDLISGDVETRGGSQLLTPEDKNLAFQKEKVDVAITMNGPLMKPDITYDILVPDVGISTGSFAMAKLNQIKQDPNQLLQQVAYLLFAGRFIPPSSANSNLLVSSGVSNLGKLVSSQVTGMLNNLLGRALKGRSLGLNIDYNSYSATGEQGDPLARNDFRASISQSLFNNRVRVELGGNIDWGRSNGGLNQAATSSNFAGDFRVEYPLTLDGRISIFAFSQSNYDILINGNRTRTGGGISYKRDFDSFLELLGLTRQQMAHDSIRRSNMLKDSGNTLHPDPMVR